MPLDRSADLKAFTPKHFSRTKVERTIAVVRVIIAVTSLIAVWLDPEGKGRYSGLTHSLYSIYVLFSVLLLAVMWRRDNNGRLPLLTLLADIAVASVFQYLTLGPSNPFFTYFVFALCSAALRWGWRGTLLTTAVVLASFIALDVYLSRTLGPQEFELNHSMIRVGYLIVIAVVLIYLGQHEERLREEIRSLARWPLTFAKDTKAVLPQVLEYAAGIVGAQRAVLIWSADEEPWLYLAAWPFAPVAIERLAPAEFEPIVADALSDATFVSQTPLSEPAVVHLSEAGVVTTWRGLPVNARLTSRLEGAGLVSTPLWTDRVTGRVFFSGLQSASVDLLPLVEVVGREIGSSLEQLHFYERSREVAIAADRIRLARDLHDGVLQSLTGIRLELQSMATVDDGDNPTLRADRLLGLERALALEQSELRRFINDLKPSSDLRAGASLADRLEELRRRITLEWRTPITIRVSEALLPLAPAFDRAVPLMVHEAIVNALKHGHPTEVSVDVRADDDALVISVADDGQGFPFRGRHGHATLEALNAGPVSLRERVASLGGTIAIESTATGSRVELTLPLAVAHA